MYDLFYFKIIVPFENKKITLSFGLPGLLLISY